MNAVSDQQLIAAAGSALNPQKVGHAFLADVGAALLSPAGVVYTGASIGTHLGICAEQGAASALVASERPVISSVVAVWRDRAGRLHVIPPCGRCREFMLGLATENKATRVVLGPQHVVSLADLLPSHGWHAEPV